MKIEYAGANTLYHLKNGVTISFFNEHTPLVFLRGIKEIGRYNLAASNFTAREVIDFAKQVSFDKLIEFFS